LTGGRVEDHGRFADHSIDSSIESQTSLVDIQSVGVAAYTSQLGTAGGATQGASITELAQQQGVTRDSLDQLVDRSPDHDHEPRAGTDQSASSETPLAGYTADAQRTAGRVGGSGTISILA
jgi:hypothetical protein